LTVERDGTSGLERRYYLSSMPLDAKLFAYAVRCHWHIENRLHWVLDVVFHEDFSRLRSGAGRQNIATVCHGAMNLLRGPKDKHSLKVQKISRMGHRLPRSIAQAISLIRFQRFPWPRHPTQQTPPSRSMHHNQEEEEPSSNSNILTS